MVADGEGPPRRPGGRPKRCRRRRCAFVGHLGLHQQIGSSRPLVRVVEQRVEDVARHAERDVADHPVGLAWPTEPTDVAGDHTDPIDVGVAAAKPFRELAVTFDRHDPDTGSDERIGQGATSRPDLDDQVGRGKGEPLNCSGDHSRVDEEVLAVGSSSLVGR